MLQTFYNYNTFSSLKFITVKHPQYASNQGYLSLEFRNMNRPE